MYLQTGFLDLSPSELAVTAVKTKLSELHIGTAVDSSNNCVSKVDNIISGGDIVPVDPSR